MEVVELLATGIPVIPNSDTHLKSTYRVQKYRVPDDSQTPQLQKLQGSLVSRCSWDR